MLLALLVVVGIVFVSGYAYPQRFARWWETLEPHSYESAPAAPRTL
jgi:hypothetical protein